MNPLEEQRSKALTRWLAAKEAHSKAHTAFYRLRMQLPPRDQMNAMQRDLYNIARAELSQATKKRAEEEQIYNISVNPLLSKPIDAITDAMHDAIAKAVAQFHNAPESTLVSMKASKEHQEMMSTVKEQSEHSPQVRADLEIARRTARARMQGIAIDPVFLDEDNSIPSIPKRPPNHLDNSPVLELERDISGEPIDDSLMDTDPDPVPDAVNIEPDTPTEIEPQTDSEPESRRERVLSNPLWASIAQAASQFAPPPKASPLEQEGNGMPKAYDEYVRERELANTPQFTQTPKGDSDNKGV